MSDPVLTFTDRGIYCPAGDFYIDPWRPVDRALITHGHADHARPGHRRYLATEAAAPVMRHRLGEITLDTIRYGERRCASAAQGVLSPGGPHPRLGADPRRGRRRGLGRLGRLQDRRRRASRTVRAGSLPQLHHANAPSACRSSNGTSQADSRARRSTPGGPRTPREGRASILGAYSLGKAQRLIAALDAQIGPILTHGAVEARTRCCARKATGLPETLQVTPETDAQGPSRRAGPRTTRRARHTLGAAVRRRPRLGFASRLDAAARGAAPARGRPGLRGVGSRRLGRTARQPSARRARKTYMSRMVTRISSRAG